MSFPRSYQDDGVIPDNPNSELQAGVSMQEAIMNLQDEQLLDIEAGVQNLKEMGLAIGQEAETQNAIVNDIDMTVVKAADNFHDEVGKVEQLIKMERSCKVWHVSLLFSLVLALLVWMAPHSPWPWSPMWVKARAQSGHHVRVRPPHAH